MRTTLRTCVAIAFFFTLAVSAKAASANDRIVEGAATSQRLWLRYSSGSLVSYDLESGQSAVVSTQTADLTTSGSRILALSKSGGAYRVIDLRMGGSLSPPLLAGDGALTLAGGPQTFVLGRKSVFRLERGKWIARTLDAPLSWGSQVSALVTSGGRIYVGFNRGEWGGGLYIVDAKSGHVQEVRRLDQADACYGPLAHECDPVTGIVPDHNRPDCVLVSIGLAHMLSHGRILRVCGTKVDIVFSRATPVHPGIFGKGNTWPFFGLAATSKGWVAISYGHLFRSADGVVTQMPLPKLADWHGLRMAKIDNSYLALSSDINWTQSLSGPTPLLIPIQH